MSDLDLRGAEITGATPGALVDFEAALAAFQSWRSGVDDRLEAALSEAPEFIMAHVLQAYLRLLGRDPLRAHSASEVLARIERLPANERERRHVAAIGAALADDYEVAKSVLDGLLRQYPHDVVALQVAHALDYITGDVAEIRDRVERVLPAWSDGLPGYHAVLAMLAFGLEERGEYARAEECARRALSIEPFDARAHHALAHVYEMTGRADAGVQWMAQNIAYWASGSVVARHCWWHVALYRLTQGDILAPLSLYDERVRPDRSPDVSDMIDAAALLWRIELYGGDVGGRWVELTAAWTPHVDDGFCTFNDLHAMLAFVGARNWSLARRLERELVQRASTHGRHAQTTRRVGLPACRAVMAFGQRDYSRAIHLLAGLPELAHRIGGSHAQRDVLHLTLLRAVEAAGRHDYRVPRAA